MDPIGAVRARWPILTTEYSPCPECGGELEQGYVRDRHSQGHWRGIEADICEDCGYYDPLDAGPR